MKVLTHEEYLAESRMFGFVGCYRFWRTLVESTPPGEDLRTAGYQFLQQIADMIANEKQGQPLTSYEAEALEYCGVTVYSEYLQ